MAYLRIAVLFVAWASSCFVPRADDGDSQLARDQQALAPWQVLVGQWRGVGQPKRGSNRDTWLEQAEWSWHFAEGRAELVAEITDGRFFTKLQLQPGDGPGKFVLLATLKAPDNSKGATEPIRFAGSAIEGALVLTADAPDGPARITLRTVAGGDRLIVLYEKSTAGGAFARQGEVASTRRGSSFAKAAAAGPECVVTGGLAPSPWNIRDARITSAAAAAEICSTTIPRRARRVPQAQTEPARRKTAS